MLNFWIIFCQFQAGVAYKSVTYKKKRVKFDPVKEILKIYIFIKKVIVLRKIYVTMKPFAPSLSAIERN